MLKHLLLSTLAGMSPGESPALESLLVSNGATGTVDVVDLQAGERELTLRLDGGPGCMAISPDGKTAVVAMPGAKSAGHSIGVVDLVHQSLIRTIRLEGPGPEVGSGTMTFWRPRGIAFLPDGQTVVVSSEGTGLVAIVHLGRAQVLGSARSGGELPQDIVVSADGRYAMVTNRGSGNVGVINLSRRRLSETIDVGGDPGAATLSPDKRTLWVANRGTNSISVIDMAERSVRVEFPCGSYPQDLEFTPDGQFLLCANLAPGSISVFDVGSLKAISEIAMPRISQAVANRRPAPPGLIVRRSSMPNSIEVSENGSLAWVALQRLDEVVEISLRSGKILRRFQVGAEPTKLIRASMPAPPVQSK